MSTALQDRIFNLVRDRTEAIGHAPLIVEIAQTLAAPDWKVRSAIDALLRDKRLVRTSEKRNNLRVADQVDLRGIGTEQLRAELARRGVTLDALSAPKSLQVGRCCAAYGCFETVKPGMLMCRDHWFQVDNALRATIMAAFSARNLKAFQDAVEQARDQLGGFERVVERTS